MEYWKIGMMGRRKELLGKLFRFLLTQPSIIPKTYLLMALVWFRADDSYRK